jgi:Outer membrane protein beta-barrel domain
MSCNLQLDRLRVVALLIFFLCVASVEAVSQNFHWAKRNNPEYDKRRISYGFSIGLHTTAYQIKYDEDFVTPKYDTVHSIQPSFSPGFSLGFLVNLRFNDQLDLRLMPKASFYEHRLNYYYTDRTEKFQLVETTMVEFPLLLKYKSQRRGNVRMYVVGGLTPAFEARNKGDLESTTSRIEIQKGNLSLDTGIGFDFYFPLFKLSPEIRFSKGLLNLLSGGNSVFSDPIKRINSNTISVYFIFQ